MININTNLSSLTVQNNLKTSTNGLNTAIERLTTGYKINHAKDNAANYSISTNIASQLSSYEVALDNTSMGMDLITTASDNLDLISSHLQRMRDLAEQAANGTYGEDSLEAIQEEVDARTAEINRIIANTEYNGIKLFEADTSGVTGSFISEVTQLSEEEALAQGYTVIKTADELQAMQDNLSGKYILMNDIDLSGYDWSAIGTYSNPFKGELNGNGYVIKNLTINKPDEDYQGLFGYTSNATIKNVGLENVDVTGKGSVGGLVGWVDGYDYGVIENSYVTGNITGKGRDYAGGLAGVLFNGKIVNCYASADVTGICIVGGLVGWDISGAPIKNCYATGKVSGQSAVGGLVGEDEEDSPMQNSYATGKVTGSCSGGFIGATTSGVTQLTNNYYNTETTGQTRGIGDDLSTEVTGVTTAKLNELIENGTLSIAKEPETSETGIDLQVGIHSNENSQIKFEKGFDLSVNVNVTSSQSARSALNTIDNALSRVSAKQTDYGAVQNRLESAAESIQVNIENLTSTQSTIKDADIAEVSSEYIRNQILQQAAATLLATANQSPSIALQLL